MEGIKMKRNLLILALFIFTFLTNCSTGTEDEPEHELELIIKNGFYQKIGNSEENMRCVIEFDYVVFEKSCYIDGYNIQWNDQSRSHIIWYLMKKLEPEHIYSIRDTFNFQYDLSEGPIISMQGYLEDIYEPDSSLQVQYQLEIKKGCITIHLSRTDHALFFYEKCIAKGQSWAVGLAQPLAASLLL
jgi:hypothetical protein